MSEFLLGLIIGAVGSPALIWLAKAGWTWVQNKVNQEINRIN